MKCDIKNSDFKFDQVSSYEIKKKLIEFRKVNSLVIRYFEFNWTFDRKAILTKIFVSSFLQYFFPLKFNFNMGFHNLNSIDLDLFDDYLLSLLLLKISN